MNENLIVCVCIYKIKVIQNSLVYKTGTRETNTKEKIKTRVGIQ